MLPFFQFTGILLRLANLLFFDTSVYTPPNSHTFGSLWGLRPKWEWAGPDSDRRPSARQAPELMLDWNEYKDWVYHKYAKSWAPSIMTYSKKYSYILFSGDIKDIDKITPKTKNTSIKSLVILSKYLGIHEEFKASLKNYGVKLFQADAFGSFMRLYNNPSSDLMEWYTKALTVLRPNEQLYLQFLRLAGLRKEEGMTSFNKIIELSKEDKLSDYFNEEKSLLEHFKYKEEFLRGTKNVYVSILPKSLVLNITKSEPVTYGGLYKRLMRSKMMSRVNELRDYFGTYMVRNGLIKEEVDLLQGRIPPSIFIRHYWSPSFTELKERTLKALENLTQKWLLNYAPLSFTSARSPRTQGR